MSKYATQKTFDGRRARCGDIVIIACAKYDVREKPEPKMCLRAGIVGAISSSKDIPYLRDLRAGVVDIAPESWTFVATKTEADIEKLEIGQWTWPLVGSGDKCNFARFDYGTRFDCKREVLPGKQLCEEHERLLTIPRQKCQDTGPFKLPCSQDAVPGQFFCAEHLRP